MATIPNLWVDLGSKTSKGRKQDDGTRIGGGKDYPVVSFGYGADPANAAVFHGFRTLQTIRVIADIMRDPASAAKMAKALDGMLGAEIPEKFGVTTGGGAVKSLGRKTL